MPEHSVIEVFETNQALLMSLPGVVAVGIGEHDVCPCIRVIVEKATQAVKTRISGQFDGHPVIVDETGPINALDGQ